MAVPVRFLQRLLQLSRAMMARAFLPARAAAGRVEVQWDAGDHASGIYLYKVTAGEYTDSRKMVLLK